MAIVRTHTFPSQYRETLCQSLTQTPVLLSTLTAQIAAIALAQYSPQIQTDSLRLTLALKALLKRAFEQQHLWDKISQEVWVNLLTWTVQDLEIPIAIGVIQSIAQSPYREELWHRLINPASDSPIPPESSSPASVLEPLLERLETLICQDLTAQILKNPQTLEPLFLELPPPQSILEIPLPALTIHPCNALEDPHNSDDISQAMIAPAPSPVAPPIVLEHYLTRPSELYRLPWELMGQVKQQCGLPMAQLLFLLIGHTVRRPHRPLTLTHREILEQLDWETSAAALAAHTAPPPDLPYILQQLGTLTLTTLWMTEPTAAAQIEAISTSGHPWEILSETQGHLDWVTGRISPAAASSITLRPGLWLHHLFEKGGLSARSAWKTFGHLALTLLEQDHCRDPFLISLLIVLSLNAPEPQPEARPSCYTVHTLLDSALPTPALATLQLHPDIAPTLFKIWYQALASLVNLGWTSCPLIAAAPAPDAPDAPDAQPTDFYIAPFPAWLNIHSHSRKPTDWIAQWLAQPLQFIPPPLSAAALNGDLPSTRTIRFQHRLRLDRLSGSEIRSARKAKQLTQSQLADVLHVHQSLIAKIEVGQRTVTEDLERSLRQVLEL